MKRKLLSLIVASLLVVGCLVGCVKTDDQKTDATKAAGTGTQASVGAKTEGATGAIGFSISTLNNPFFVSMADSAKATAKEMGLDLTVVSADNDSAKQTSDVEDLISKGIKVLIINPEDSAAIAPAVKDAQAKGIKVIAVDRYVEDVTVDTYIGTDNVKAGEAAAKEFLAKVGEGADIAVLQGILGASSAIDRYQGFMNVLKDKVSVVADQTANYDRTEGLTVTEDILQAHPGIKGIIAANDEMALGAIQAISGAGKKPGQDIVVGGFDATDDAKEAVDKGEMLYTVEQQTVEMGKQAVVCADKFMKGETVEDKVPIDIVMIKK